MRRITLSTFEFLLKLLNGNYKSENSCCMKSSNFHFVLLNDVHVSYHYVGWTIIYFQEVRGFVELCAIGLQPGKQTQVH
jgi:hypothetical protein